MRARVLWLRRYWSVVRFQAWHEGGQTTENNLPKVEISCTVIRMCTCPTIASLCYTLPFEWHNNTITTHACTRLYRFKMKRSDLCCCGVGACQRMHMLHTLNLEGNLTGNSAANSLTALLRAAPGLVTVNIEVLDISKAAATTLLTVLSEDPLRSPQLKWMCHDRILQVS